MDTHTKSTVLHTLQLYLYGRALHPELFELKSRRVITHGAYELETWVLPRGHVLRFEHGNKCFTELVSEKESGLPDSPIETFYCAGERDFDKKFAADGVTYMTSVQTEQLNENLYASTYDELRDFAREQEASAYLWDEEGPCLSMLDIQRYDQEIHVQAYHMIARGRIVLRTQTLFEHA